jgi:hypothetical protein
LLEFRKEHPQVKSLVVVALVDTERRTADGIRILPYQSFLKALWNGEWNPA